MDSVNPERGSLVLLLAVMAWVFPVPHRHPSREGQSVPITFNPLLDEGLETVQQLRRQGDIL